MPRLAAELNQSLLRGGQRLPRREVARALLGVAQAMRLRRDRTVSVAFVSEAEIRRLNKAYRGKDKVTDVLSFEEEKMEDSLGEILICYPQARRQAREMGHSVRQEALFLLVHGLLHLFGFDHERPMDATRMFARQTRILDALGIDSRL